MAYTTTVSAGKQFAETEKITIPKLNQLGNPTVTVTGDLSDAGDVNYTPTPATTGQGIYWDNGNSEWRVTDDASGQRILGKYVTEMSGADASNAGVRGTVPPPSAGEDGLFLRGDATWAVVPGQTGNDLYNNENLY